MRTPKVIDAQPDRAFNYGLAAMLVTTTLVMGTASGIAQTVVDAFGPGRPTPTVQAPALRQ
jgi:hypothetical protein